MIIAAFAGVGKTTLAKNHPDKVIDFVCMPYKYYLEPSLDGCEDESNKANFDYKMQVRWPFNYVDAIEAEEIKNSYKIILIPSDSWVLKLLEKKNIKYSLVYPKRSAKENYRKRYIDRGNKESFMEVFIDRWDEFLGMLENNTYGQHLVLEPQQFLSDVISVENLVEAKEHAKEG